MLALLIALATPSAAAPKEVVRLAQTAHWDYLTFDDVSRRLYVTSGDHVAVIDVDGGKQVGTVPNTAGVHGV
ncbi:MAG TPA: YncE family protein, partial [Pinirhizobacter sp.]